MANDRSDSRRKQDPEALGADGWPQWMGDADPAMAPKPPPKPKILGRPAPAAAARENPPAARPVLSAAAAPPAPEARPRRRGLWTLACGFAIVLALVGGDVAARFRPDAALSFQQAAAKLLDRVPASVPPVALWRAAGGAAFVLVLLLIWQAGRARRPLFLPLALLLCAASASVGLYRGGRDIDLERSAAAFRGKVGSLESEMGDLRRKLDAALANQEKANASVQKSSMALQEREEALSALRKEIEELKKKLAEKDQ